MNNKIVMIDILHNMQEMEKNHMYSQILQFN